MPNANLSSLEADVITWLLRGDEPVLAALRKQLATATMLSRDLTGKGFYLKFKVSSDADMLFDRLAAKRNFYLGDVEAQITALKNGAGFVLWITDGKLDMLEGYTFGEDWPTQTSSFELRYLGGERDWHALRKQWRTEDT